MRRWVTAVALLSALAVITGGCASAGASGPGAADGAATVVPGNAVAFVAASTDLSSSQWHGLGEFALKQLEQQTKVSWTNDVQPIVGGELDVALLPGKQAVAFVQPTDSGKLDDFAKQHQLVTRTFGAWTGVSKEAATLDAVGAATTHLSDSSTFTDAMKALPDGALARAYVNGDEVHTLLPLLPGSTLRDWASAALIGTDAGLELEAFSSPAAADAQPYTSALVDKIPSGVLAAVDVKLPAGGLGRLPAQLTTLVGAGTAKALSGIVGGETAVYVRPSLPMPEVTLVSEPADPAAAASALDTLVSSQSGLLGSVTLHHRIVGNELVVSTTAQGVDAFGGPGAKLSADPAFVAAQKNAGMPDATTGFAYADVRSALPLLALAGMKLPAGLPQLGSFLAYGAAADGRSTFSAFLGVG